MENIPDIPEEVKQKSYQYRNMRSAKLFGWNSTGEKMLALTRFSETNQVIEISGPLGYRKQVTFYEEPILSAVFSRKKNENAFLFSKDLGGNEVYQVFKFDLHSGRDQLLTDGNSRNGLGPISNDGEKFIFTSNRRNGKDMNIHIGYMNGQESTLVFPAEGYWIPLDWSPDDKFILVEKFVSNYENYLYLIEIQNGQMTEIGNGSKMVAIGGAGFSRDGDQVFFISDEDTEFKILRSYDIQSGEIDLLTKDLAQDIEAFTLSQNNKYICFTSNKSGYNDFHVRRIRGFRKEKLPEIPLGIITDISFNPDNNRIGFTLYKPDSPGDIYSVNLNEGELVRWTKSETGGLLETSFTAPELIEYSTFDSLRIPAFYYRPDGKGPFPVVIYIHGGPESQHRPLLRANIQYWVNEMGIAVIAPNVRGSSGYGKTFQSLDNEYRREDAVLDIGHLLDHISKMSELDPGRIAVYGGSYGGYMVLASLVHFNDRLAAGIDRVGISNLVTFLKSTKPYRRDLRRKEYGDERHPQMRAFFDEISPLNNAEKITKPLFIVQGLNDPRVPVSEAEQLRDVIRKNGGEVWYLLAKDEGHGFKKKFNRDWDMNASSLFLKKYLLSPDAVDE